MIIIFFLSLYFTTVMMVCVAAMMKRRRGGNKEGFVDLAHYSRMCDWCESSPDSHAGSSQGCGMCPRAKLMMHYQH